MGKLQALLIPLLLPPLLLRGPVFAQPADCASAPEAEAPAAPMALNLGGLPGVPAGVSGQIYVATPWAAGGMTCTDQRPPPRDILRGEPGDALHGPQGDLLRGP